MLAHSLFSRFVSRSRDSSLNALLDQLLGETFPVRKIVPLGVGASGKTTLLLNVPRVQLDSLPSGLAFDYRNVQELNDARTRTKDANKALHETGLPMTLKPESHSFWVFTHDRPSLHLNLMDLAGQPLKQSFTYSEKDQLDRLQENMEAAVTADVIYVIVAPPATEDPVLIDRFQDDLRVCRRFSLDVLAQRRQPVALAIVITKIDLLVNSPAEATERLKTDWLQKVLGSLLNVVRNDNSPRGKHLIRGAAIIPITSFGFGRATQLHQVGGAPSVTSHENGSTSALKPNMECRPFNLETLLMWSTLAAILVRPKAYDYDQLQPVARALRQDLKASESWLIPIVDV